MNRYVKEPEHMRWPVAPSRDGGWPVIVDLVFSDKLDPTCIQRLRDYLDLLEAAWFPVIGPVRPETEQAK